MSNEIEEPVTALLSNLFLTKPRAVLEYTHMDVTHFLYALLSGIIPPLLWLWFWLREDNLHPEPRRLIFGCFLMGMGAVVLALILQTLINPFVHDIHFLNYLYDFSDEQKRYILFAATEEISKFLAAYIVAFHAAEMDEPVDALMYLITVALGFAALENTLFVMKSYYNINQVFVGDVTQALSTGNMRFIGASLLHLVSSACIGVMIGLNFYRAKIVQFVMGLVGLVGAIALHSVFNLSIIKVMSDDALGTLKIFSWVWGAAIVLLIAFEEVKGLKKPRPKAEPKQVPQKV